MDLPVIFEDDYLIVVDKPSGVVVNRADSAKEETVQDFAEKRVQKSESDEEFNSRGGIVHRLDKDTSGVLVIAKTSDAFQKLKNQFKSRTTTKKYLALVHGKVEPSQGVIDAPIERSPFNRMQFGVFPGGREAQTKYKTVGVYELSGEDKGQNIVTLVELEPKTGRTHQIRVHMKYIGHPLVSDPIYGGRKQGKKDLSWCPRLFLHAKELTVAHPGSGEEMMFEAELPDELKKALPEKQLN